MDVIRPLFEIYNPNTKHCKDNHLHDPETLKYPSWESRFETKEFRGEIQSNIRKVSVMASEPLQDQKYVGLPIIGWCQANERRYYFATTSLIGWVQV